MQTNLQNTFWELYETVGQHFISLVVNLLAMILVARNFELSGFGVFSYLAALFHLASFISEAGICDRFQNRYAMETAKGESLRDAAGALFCTGILTVLFFLITAAYDTSHTRIEEHVVAYILIAAAVPLRNGNRLRTTLLHVSGRHRDASRSLVKKHALFLICIWSLSMFHQPSLLIGAFLISELFQRVTLGRKTKIGKLFRPAFFTHALQTLRRSLRHLFSGETLNLIFHVDFFILGLFATSIQVGIYAEAALFGRFFLLIPVGAKPILHRHFARLAVTGDAHKLSKSVFNMRAYVFYIHALLALFLAMFFDDTIHTLLGFYGSEKVSYDLFTILLPGFLFYAAAIVNEAALEASGNAPFLSRLSAAILGINICLGFYLIPFAGTLGAAWSTLFCLLVYFFIICTVKITAHYRNAVIEFAAAGSATYLVYELLKWINLPLFLFAVVVPPALYLIFYLLNFFDFDDYHLIAEPNVHS